MVPCRSDDTANFIEGFLPIFGKLKSNVGILNVLVTTCKQPMCSLLLLTTKIRFLSLFIFLNKYTQICNCTAAAFHGRTTERFRLVVRSREDDGTSPSLLWFVHGRTTERVRLYFGFPTGFTCASPAKGSGNSALCLYFCHPNG